MSPDEFGYVIGGALMMFVFFLIFLGLLALIHPLRQRFALRNVVAWFLSAAFIVHFSGSVGGEVTLLYMSAICCGLGASLRYILVTRKNTAVSN